VTLDHCCTPQDIGSHNRCGNTLQRSVSQQAGCPRSYRGFPSDRSSEPTRHASLPLAMNNAGMSGSGTEAARPFLRPTICVGAVQMSGQSEMSAFAIASAHSWQTQCLRSANASNSADLNECQVLGSPYQNANVRNVSGYGQKKCRDWVGHLRSKSMSQITRTPRLPISSKVAVATLVHHCCFGIKSPIPVRVPNPTHD
jgi:hypothetical protein